MNVLDRIRARIEALEVRVARNHDAFQEQLSDLSGSLRAVDESSSHSWIGYHSQLYYRDYERPPLGSAFDSMAGAAFRPIPDVWQQRSYEDVRAHVEGQTDGPTLEAIWSELRDLTNEAHDAREELLTELTAITEQEGYESERALLKEIEDMHWGTKAEAIIQRSMPKGAMTRDTRAMGGGIQTPPHIRYIAELNELMGGANALDHFISLAKRLVRQVEIRSQLKAQAPATLAGMDEVVRICDHFHAVARQLQSRHESRNTIGIDDEYDVQDLLHGLLKLFFDDIRPEEPTPSFAGKSSRIDFLLKEARIVVEVKKTRVGLGEKEIGDQLILDIARYQDHPDCSTLICFVYDPEGKIGNPRGLEADLQARSTDALNVIVVVRP